MEENKTNQVELQKENNRESLDAEQNNNSLTWKEKLQNISKKQIAIFAGVGVAIIAIVIASIFLFGGNKGGSGNDGPSAEAIREVEVGFAETAYSKLNSAAKTTSEVMRGIYGAWYYAIYESDQGKDYNRMFNLADKLGFSYSEIETAVKSLGYSTLNYEIFTDFNKTVKIADAVYEARGTYDEIDGYMDSAKNLLQKISKENYEYTSHAKLTSYYSEVLTCYQFVQSPSGSLVDLKNRITSFESKVGNYKNELSIAFD